MPPIPGRNEVRVLTHFPMEGDARGNVYTSGRVGVGKPELLMRTVPTEKQEEAVDILEHFQALKIGPKDALGSDGAMFVVFPIDKRDVAKVLQDHMPECSKRARVLELRSVVPKDAFKTADNDVLNEIAAAMLEGPCAGCGQGCKCATNPRREMAVYKDVDGSSVYTGIHATKSGVFKIHDNDRTLESKKGYHHMDVTEYEFDMSYYDDPLCPIPIVLQSEYAKRTFAAKEANEVLKRRMEKFEAEGYSWTWRPEHVRTGDLVLVYSAKATCCKDPRCVERAVAMDVLAVHHNDGGIVVEDDDHYFPMRIELEHVFASVKGKHW